MSIINGGWKVLAAAVMATLAWPAAPASAAAPQVFSHSGTICMDAWGTGIHPLRTFRCNIPSDRYQQWNVRSITEPRAHAGTVVELKNLAAGTCVDSNGVNPGTITYVSTCNNTSNQRWEVFRDTVTGKIRFKSWGAFAQGSLHTCLAYDGSGDETKGYVVRMETCNANSNLEYWE